MAEEFNIKEGIAKSLKTALQNDSFISAVFSMLMGEKGAEKEVEYQLKSAAQENTLNEVVSVHRLYKHGLSENAVIKLANVPKELLGRLNDVRKKSSNFQKKVLIRTLKKPGMFKRFIYIIKSLCTAGYPIDDVIATPMAIKFITALVETAIEVAREEHETEAALAESFDPDTTKHVSLFVGRFQPFTRGHVKCMIELQKMVEKEKKIKVPVVICAILVNKPDKEHPFCGKLQKDMYEQLKIGLNEQFPGLLAENGLIYVDRAYIGDLVAKVKEELGYQTIAWGCGTDRYEIITPRKRPPKEGQSPFVRTGYLPQTEKYIEQQNTLDPEERDIDTDPKNGFKLHHIQRDILGNGDDPVSKISGTKVREAIMSNDRDAFKKMVPECLYGLFDGFKDALDRIYGGEKQVQNTAPEPAYQSITESKAYRDFKKRLNKGLDELLK